MLTTRKGNKRFAFYDLKLTLAWEAAPSCSEDGQAEAEGDEDGRGGRDAPVSGELSVAEFGSGSDHDDIEVSITANGEQTPSLSCTAGRRGIVLHQPMETSHGDAGGCWVACSPANDMRMMLARAAVKQQRSNNSGQQQRLPCMPPPRSAPSGSVALAFLAGMLSRASRAASKTAASSVLCSPQSAALAAPGRCPLFYPVYCTSHLSSRLACHRTHHVLQVATPALRRRRLLRSTHRRRCGRWYCSGLSST